MRAVSPSKENREDPRIAMEEDFQRAFGESVEEVVGEEIGEEAVRARAGKAEAAPSQRGKDTSTKCRVKETCR